MTKDITPYLGRKFHLGFSDCYDVIREFYQTEYGLVMRNYARPDDFWNKGLDLYMDNFRNEGFRIFNGHPKDYLPGDAFLMSIQAPIANHAAVLLEDGRILHHLYGCLSTADSYDRSFYRNQTVAVLRHPTVAAAAPKQMELQDLMELIPETLRQRLGSPEWNS